MNWQTIQAIDFDAAAAATYRANSPGVETLCCPVSDRLGKLPAADLILGGPPCQPFSQAGDGEGEADDRDCIPDYVAAVGEVKPRQFLMENVRGLLTKKHFPYFCRAVEALEGHGYAVQWRLLDAVNYGVPQFRKRVWVWGIRADLCRDGARHRWPEPTHQWPPQVGLNLWGSPGLLAGVTVGQALGLDGMLWRKRGKGMMERSGERRDHPTTEPSPAITAAFALGGGGGLFLKSHADPAQGIDRPAPTLRSGGDGHDGCCLRLIGKVEPYRWSDAFYQKHPPATADAPAPTVYKVIYKGGGHGLLAVDAPSHTINGESREPIQGWKDKGYVRRLTPAECGRLQSVPDSFVWPDGITKTNAYRVVGNGWACGMAAHLSRALAAADPDGRTVLDLFSGGGLGACGWHGRAWTYQPESEAAA